MTYSGGEESQEPKQHGGPPRAPSVGSHDRPRPEGTKEGNGVTQGITLGAGAMEVGPLDSQYNHRGSSIARSGPQAGRE